MPWGYGFSVESSWQGCSISTVKLFNSGGLGVFSRRNNHFARLAEVNTNHTWPTLRSELDDMHLIEYESIDGNVWQRTELTEAQKTILSLLKLPEPPKIWEITLRKGQKQ